jgi:hypothetical protein
MYQPTGRCLRPGELDHIGAADHGTALEELGVVRDDPVV